MSNEARYFSFIEVKIEAILITEHADFRWLWEGCRI